MIRKKTGLMVRTRQETDRQNPKVYVDLTASSTNSHSVEKL